ncbi:MAG TPA: TrkA C-terminal domain-containing protein [bacterium]|jgi:putative transport protein|nr:TrkA C-terminal domain-containing protein [bacterium]HNZ52862.1 TrkA C-terminal domain-containing protein [bacterium]HOB71555.1 TrkA C-terminal domain-containing protein [bacterium]HOG43412.1 TrkA C-terminal domain-containing protein [bacterium]HPV20507.1 TrkA C-terminal domain-containing protein [bacterium]
MQTLLSNSVFVLFLIIATGKILEQIKIRNFSLGIASIFIIASIFGYYGFVIPKDFEIFALALFVYCVGIEAGPQFFTMFSKKGRSWIIVPPVYVFFLILFTSLLALAAGGTFSAGSYTGLFAGAFISTPAMASALVRSGDNAIGAAFGIIYPISLIGNVYLISYLPVIFRHNVVKLISLHKEQSENSARSRIFKFFKVTNPNITGKHFGSLTQFKLSGVVFSRYIENGKSFLANDNIILNEGGYVAAVGSPENLENLEILIGPSGIPEIDKDDSVTTAKILISKSNVAGKTLGELSIEDHFNVKITRLIRGSVELSPDSGKQLVLGDKIVVIGNSESIQKLTEFLGDDVNEIFKTQFAPVSIGIVLGMIAGNFPIPGLGYSLGFTGGILAVSMFLGNRVKFASILWQMPQQTNSFLRQLSLYIFFAALGTSTGGELINIFINPGSTLFVSGAILLAFLPVIFTYGFSTFVLRKDPLETVGLIAGTLNSTSAVLNSNEVLKTDIQNTAFAFAYPVGLILAILSTELFQILSLFIVQRAN